MESYGTLSIQETLLQIYLLRLVYHANIFKKTKNVWFDDAYLNTANCSYWVTSDVKENRLQKINQIKGAFKKAGKFLNEFKVKMYLTWSLAGLMKVFFNTKIRAGVKLADTKKLVKEFEQYYMDRMMKEIDSKKSDKGKKKYRDMQTSAKKELKKFKNEIVLCYGYLFGNC